MTAGSSAWFRCTLLCLCFLLLSAEQKDITAEAGQNVILPCKAKNNSINIVEWSRAALETNVLVYRDGRFLPDEQHPSFKNRVDLQDRRMKGGYVSLVLKDVTADDTGTYECRVRMGKSSSLELIRTIYLSVAPPGQQGGLRNGSVRLRVGLQLLPFIAVSVVFYVLCRSKTQIHRSSYTRV